MRSVVGPIVVVIALLGATPTKAATYSVNDAPGNPLGITGVITTDGTIGFLSAANIVDWNLTIPATNGGVTFTLNVGNSSLSLGSNLLSATPAALSFNFSNSTPASLSFLNALQYSIIWSSGISFSGVLGGTQQIGDGPCAFCFANSSPFFGTAGIGVVPVPTALPLFLSGLGLFGLLSRHKRRKATADTTD